VFVHSTLHGKKAHFFLRTFWKLPCSQQAHQSLPSIWHKKAGASSIDGASFHHLMPVDNSYHSTSAATSPPWSFSSVTHQFELPLHRQHAVSPGKLAHFLLGGWRFRCPGGSKNGHPKSEASIGSKTMNATSAVQCKTD